MGEMDDHLLYLVKNSNMCTVCPEGQTELQSLALVQ